MNFVSLAKGKIQISFGNDKREHTFKPSEFARIGDLIAKHRAWSFMYSSSCDFPDEGGFRKNFSITKVLSRAVGYARDKLAIPIKAGPLDNDTDVRIEKAAEKFGSFPVTFKFRRCRKTGVDVVLTFQNGTDLEYFLSGIRYARRLSERVKS
jgi:hypothetical protein